MQTASQHQQPGSAMPETVRGVVHDVRNGLTAIRGAAELISLAQPDAGDLAALIVAQADRLAAMMQDLLANRRETDRPQLATVDLPVFAADLAATQMPAMVARGIDLMVEVEVDQADFDAGQVRRAIDNLLTNAADAMPDGGALGLRLTTAGPYLEIEVEDSGLGMTPETLEHVFEPFFTYGKAHGTGLGMTLAKAVAEGHGGHAHVQSSVGRGTVVTLCLPRPGLERRSEPNPNRSGRALRLAPSVGLAPSTSD
jgi:signal transduction histidine kinase